MESSLTQTGNLILFINITLLMEIVNNFETKIHIK